jgi:hypothetical protein
MGAEALLWIACYDVDATDAGTAQELFESANITLPPDFVRPVVEALGHPHGDMRTAAAAALAAGLQVIPGGKWA